MPNPIPWLTLKSVEGVGDLLFRRLIDRFGSPERALEAPPGALAAVEGIRPAVAKRIHAARKDIGHAEREFERVQKAGFRIVLMSGPEYPAMLRQVPDPPPLLYVSGSLVADEATVSVVGSRHPTSYGIDVAGSLAGDMAGMGITVVSGMAAGIDTAAHRGALDANGRTVAVLGSGLNRIYPAENRDLFHAIAANGAVVTEFTMDAEPDARHFPRRNRIISGISLGTVVVEATRRSGSLITARMALEQNREVFAVPGSIHSFKSTGAHRLIRQGAKLIEHAGHILEELPLAVSTPEAPGRPEAIDTDDAFSGLDETERAVIHALGAYPIHIDELTRTLGLGSGELVGILLQLELNGWVQQSPGGMIARTPNRSPK
jgi:DNA processing protein